MVNFCLVPTRTIYNRNLVYLTVCVYTYAPSTRVDIEDVYRVCKAGTGLSADCQDFLVPIGIGYQLAGVTPTYVAHCRPLTPCIICHMVQEGFVNETCP